VCLWKLGSKFAKYRWKWRTGMILEFRADIITKNLFLLDEGIVGRLVTWLEIALTKAGCLAANFEEMSMGLSIIALQ